jgi:hypothetical protein
MFRTTPEAPEAAMSTTITDQVREFRRHAAAQLRMVEPHNRAQLAGEAHRWSERSLAAYEAHGDARTNITGALHLTGHAKLAAALNEEAQAKAALSWSKMSGKTNVGELTERAKALRSLVTQLSATPAAHAVADFRRHAAAVRRLTRRASDHPRTQAAIVEHRDACAHLAADMHTDVAFALETEHHLLERADRYRRDPSGVEYLNRQLALVRRVVKRAVR